MLRPYIGVTGAGPLGVGSPLPLLDPTDHRMATSSSPTFRKPPVVEMMLGLQFDTLPGFTNSHLGLYWSKLDTKVWPTVEDAPTFPQQFEKFGDDRQWSEAGTINIGLSQKPSSRARFTNHSRDRMIQLQNGRFWYQWIGASTEYPRYETIRVEMADIFGGFIGFVKELGLGDVHLNQWEIGYTNHLPCGTVWHDPKDWTKVFNSNAMLPAFVGTSQLENFGGHWMYSIADNLGRLHVDLRSARDKPDGTDILALQLVSRGPVGDSDDGLRDGLAGLDLGHNTIVNGFRDLTSKEAREYWGEII